MVNPFDVRLAADIHPHGTTEARRHGEKSVEDSVTPCLRGPWGVHVAASGSFLPPPEPGLQLRPIDLLSAQVHPIDPSGVGDVSSGFASSTTKSAPFPGATAPRSSRP